MPITYRFRLKNWKLALLALLLIVFFTSLGNWQLNRAHEKQKMLDTFAERMKFTPVSAHDLNNIKDWRFYRIELSGTFDNAHTFLLDNKTYQRRIGYEVYTPFYADGYKEAILVDRGFIAIGQSRDNLPNIAPISGKVTLIGMLNSPPLYMSLGKIVDPIHISWPLRVEFIQLQEMANILKIKFFPYIALMDPADKRAYPLSWQIVIMSPERHLGYAVQWFALALTILILFVALNRDR